MSSPQQTLNKSNHSSSSSTQSGPLKVLFLSSDTGGGHRASAESLAKQFEILYPGSSYNLLDVMTKDGLPPYNRMVETYKHLSAHPKQWNLVFKLSNSRAFETFFDVSNKLLCEKAMRKSIREYDPDVVVSVHPLMTNVPVMCCEKISKETGRHLPIFTVVTDLASAHCLWFANGVDKLYIASDECRKLAKERGKVPDEKIVEIGLPIRHAFAVQADKLGQRTSEAGKMYQIHVHQELNLPMGEDEEKEGGGGGGGDPKKTILVMGGGEGVGSLSHIVDALYVQLTNEGIDALVLVVCGRNEKLKQSLEHRDWDGVLVHHEQMKQRHKMIRPSRSLLSFSACSAPPPPSSLTDGTGAENGENTAAVGTGSSSTSDKTTIAGTLSPTSLATSMGCMEGSVTQQIQRILSSSSLSKVNALGEMKLVDSEDVEIEEHLAPSPVLVTTKTIGRGTTTSTTAIAATGEDGLTKALADDSMDDDGGLDAYGTSSVGTGSLPPMMNGDTTNTTTTKVDPEALSALTESMVPSLRPPLPKEPQAAAAAVPPKKRGNVTVVGLGFVTKMAEYMVAADVLVSKAGPGTIAEAASLSLPVMLTSFLPGQEEGNVDFVVNNKFGTFISDKDPQGIAQEVGNWLLDEDKMKELSHNAKKCGAPHAARDIVKSIGRITHKWKKINDDRSRLEEEAKRLIHGEPSKDDEEEEEEGEDFEFDSSGNVEVGGGLVSKSSSS